MQISVCFKRRTVEPLITVTSSQRSPALSKATTYFCHSGEIRFNFNFLTMATPPQWPVNSVAITERFDCIWPTSVSRATRTRPKKHE